MRRIKKFSIMLLICSTVLMGVFLGYDRVKRDTRPPEISCPEETLEASIHVTEEQLLAGVSAQDNRDGDVTDALVVEKLSPITADDTRTITYAVVDAAGNVSRATRSLHYTDYKRPRFHISQPMRLPIGSYVDPLLESIQADSVVDGDLTPKIKYLALSVGGTQLAGMQPIELRVTDGVGYNRKLAMDVEFYNPSDEQLTVTLTDYLIYLPLHASFDPMKYYQDSNLPGELEIKSDVNPSIPGVYYVEYILHGEQADTVGKTRLVVVVEE